MNCSIIISNFTKETSKVTLQFKDKGKENEYHLQEDPSSGLSFFGLACAIGSTTVASILAISFNMIGFAAASATVIAVSLIGSWIVTGRTEILEKLSVRSALAVICAIAVAGTNLLYIVCGKYKFRL